MSTLALGEEVNLSWSRNDLEQLVMNKIFQESLARASAPQWRLWNIRQGEAVFTVHTITSREKGVLAGPRLGKHYACLSCGSVPGRD